MKELLNKNKFLFSLSLNFVLFAIIYLLFSPSFITNDDTAMMFIVSGVKGAAPSEFMFFTNIIIGYILKFLYVINNSLPWYGIYLISMLYISQSVIFYVLLRKYKNTTLALIVYLLYFSLIASFMLINLQFTIVATITSFSGILLLFHNINMSEKKHITEFVFGGLMLFVGSLIRWDAFLLAILSSIPFLLYQVLKTDKVSFVKLNLLTKPLLFFLLSIIISFIALQFNSYTYNKTKGYENFYEFNTLRASLMDYNLLEKISPQEKVERLNKVGWSENDYNIFKKWFIVDREIYTIENFKELTEGLKKTNITFNSISSWFKVLIFKRTKLLTNLIFVLFNVFLFFFLYKKKKSILIFIFSFSNIIFLLTLLIVMAKPAPVRVYFGMFVIFSISNTLFFEDTKFNFSKKINQLFIAVVLFATMFLTYKSITLQLNPNKDNNIKFKNYVENNLKEENIYVNWAWGLNYANISPIGETDFVRNKKIIDIGWGVVTARSLDKMEKLRITNLYTDIYKKNNVFVIVYQPGEYYVNLFEKYIEEHYNQKIEHRFIYQNIDNSSMVQFYIENK